jgi:tight adherence protein C
MTFASQEIITVCLFASVAAATYGLLALFDPTWMRVRARVRKLQTDGSAAGSPIPPSSPTSHKVWTWDIFGRFAGKEPFDRERLVQRLARAGCYQANALSRYLLARIAFTIVPPTTAVAIGLSGLVPMDIALLFGCIGGGVGTLTPGLWLDRVAARRHIKLRTALPDFLDLMVVCLEGGLSLQETIRRVGDELRLAHPELALELSIVQRDVERGATIDQALKRFALRSNYEGVRSLATFIREAQRFGTNISEALRSHSDVLRSQREQAAEESAQKASVKILLPTMLLIFPAIFVVLVGPAAMQIYQAFGKE